MSFRGRGARKQPKFLFRQRSSTSVYAPTHGASGVWSLGVVLATEARSPIPCLVTAI